MSMIAMEIFLQITVILGIELVNKPYQYIYTCIYVCMEHVKRCCHWGLAPESSKSGFARTFLGRSRILLRGVGFDEIFVPDLYGLER